MLSWVLSHLLQVVDVPGSKLTVCRARQQPTLLAQQHHTPNLTYTHTFKTKTSSHLNNLGKTLKFQWKVSYNPHFLPVKAASHKSSTIWTKVLHSTPTGTAWPWKILPSSSQFTVFVLRLMPEQVWNHTVRCSFSVGDITSKCYHKMSRKCAIMIFLTLKNKKYSINAVSMSAACSQQCLLVQTKEKVLNMLFLWWVTVIRDRLPNSKCESTASSSHIIAQ